MKNKFLLTGLILLLSYYSSQSQFIEDAIRFSDQNGTFSARSGALGTAFNGISDDISAMQYNPAGLALLNKFEFAFGFGFGTNSNSVNFIDKYQTDYKSTNQYLNNIGISVPLEFGSRKASFGLSYFMETNFDNITKFEGLNSNSSFIDYTAKNGPGNGRGSFEDNFTYHLWLAGDDLKTPVNGNNLQTGFIKEKGGLHSITGAYALELNEFITAGFSISGKWGRYSYNYEYNETDINNYYTNSTGKVYFKNDTNLPSEICDFNSLKYENTLDQEIGGISGSIGLMSQIGKHLRAGISVKFPSLYSIDEVFTESAEATFDASRDYFNNGNMPNSWLPDEGSSTYQVITPFVYSFGLSFNLFNLTISSGLNYFDASQLQFVDGPSGLDQVNNDIIDQLTGQISFGIGAEYDIPNFPMALRGSYTYTSSPYAVSYEGEAIQKIGIGAGFYVAPNIRIEALVQLNEQTLRRQNYGDGLSYYKNKMSPMNIGLQFTYRN